MPGVASGHPKPRLGAVRQGRDLACLYQLVVDVVPERPRCQDCVRTVSPRVSCDPVEDSQQDRRLRIRDWRWVDTTKPVLQEADDSLLKTSGIEVHAHRVIEVPAREVESGEVGGKPDRPGSLLFGRWSQAVKPAVGHEPSCPCADGMFCSVALSFSSS